MKLNRLAGNPLRSAGLKPAMSVFDWGAIKYRATATIFIALLFGFFVNVLQLAVPLFSLQIFERVIPSGQVATLLSLALIVLTVTSASVFIDGSRASVLVGIGSWICEQLDCGAQAADMTDPGASSIVNDLRVLRAFLSGPLCPALLDVPWSAMYLLVLGLISRWLAIYAVSAYTIVIGSALLGQIILVGRRETLREQEAVTGQLIYFAASDGPELLGVGAVPGLLKRLSTLQSSSRSAFYKLSVNQVWLEACSRSLRVMLQVGLLTVAATLTVLHQTNAGAIVASSMLFSRGLAPLERLSTHFRTLGLTGAAWRRISVFATKRTFVGHQVRIDRPQGKIGLQNVSVIFPGNRKAALQNVSFLGQPSCLHVIVGPEGSGKTTLAKLLSGSLSPTAGIVTLDDMELHNYDIEQLAELIGYLPERPSVSSSSVASFICREGDIDDIATISAATKVGLDDVIRSLPAGYQTPIGPGSCQLSGGETRRLALARAIYKTPRIVILDEPLLGFEDGRESYVLDVIQALKNSGSTVIAICRSAHLLLLADTISMLDAGVLKLNTDGETLRSFVGPKEVVS